MIDVDYEKFKDGPVDYERFKDGTAYNTLRWSLTIYEISYKT